MKYKISIVGSGLVGSIIALGLANAGHQITLLERNALRDKHDSRTTAIAYQSSKILDVLKIWSHLSIYARPIQDIFIQHKTMKIKQHYSHPDLPMGYVIHNQELNKQLIDLLQNNDNIDLKEQCTYRSIQNDDYHVALHLNTGEILESDLIILAEGKFSQAHKQYDIHQTAYDYEQISTIFNISHANSHENCAIEYFFEGGQIAVLPTINDYTSSVIFTNTTTVQDDKIIPILQHETNSYLEDPKIISSIMRYPISLSYLEKYYYKGVIFAGDHAHSLHPIAGQGLNLAIRDAISLVQYLTRSSKLGLSAQYFLKDFNRKRTLDNRIMITATHNLNNLLSLTPRLLKVPIKLSNQILQYCPGYSSMHKIATKYAMGLHIKDI